MHEKKILIIDKDTDSLNLLTSRLEARDYQVITCQTSEMALKKVPEEMPGLILVDSQMEKIEGEDIASVIKTQLLSYVIPIIMMTPRDKIAEHIMGVHAGVDDFIMKPFNPLELQLRVTMNLKRAHDCIQANPLTKLPGNVSIVHRLNEMIDSKRQFAVLYIDIDNFKSFNDKYGFEKGDDVLIQTSRILIKTAQQIDGYIFVGNVGGDDFLVITEPEHDELFARMAIKEFDRLIPTHYSKEEQHTGEIRVLNRRGQKEDFPLMSLSVASVTNVHRELSNPGQIAQISAEIKKYLKTKAGSNFLRDRREHEHEEFPPDVPPAREIELGPDSQPFGQILLNAGLISEAQLNEALKKHFSTGQRLGRILIQMNAVSSAKVGQMLEEKIGVPYVSLTTVEVAPSILRMFSEEYVKTHGTVPLKIEDGYVQVAMIDPFDLKVIDDIERITDYSVMPAIALEEEFSVFVEMHYGNGF